jgi:superfamily II DNA/RNA helicase
VGSASRLSSTNANTNAKDSTDAPDRDLFVVPVSGTRGLHLQNVEYVFILTPPTTMDEYLHMAGRTGRFGNTNMDGVVISLVTLDEMKRLKSWETPLGIAFDVQYR